MNAFTTVLPFFFNSLFTCFWLSWVFIAARGAFTSCGARAALYCGVGASHCGGFSCEAQALGHWLQWLQPAASAVVVLGLSCSMAYEIFPDRGLNLCPLHWRANSYLLYCLESPQNSGNSVRLYCWGLQNHCRW